MNETSEIRTGTVPLWKLILHAAARIEERFEAELAEANLSLSKLGVLRTLVEEGEPIPLTRLAGKLSCVKSNVTQLVDRLEAEGLVARVNDPSDRRSILASVTETGRERYEAGRHAIERAERELFAGFAPEDHDRLVELFHRFTAAGGCAE